MTTALAQLTGVSLRKCMESCMHYATSQCQSVKYNRTTTPAVCELMSIELDDVRDANETSSEPWTFFLSTWLRYSKWNDLIFLYILLLGILFFQIF